MNTWIMPCNLKYFDINERFDSYDYVVWKNGAKILKDDVVYIYVGKPFSCIKYKCVVEDPDVENSVLDENAYARIGEIERNRKYMKLQHRDMFEYRYIYEAINAVIGTHYTAWMRACWPSTNPQYPFRMWFPKLKEMRNGVDVPAAFDCLNTLSEDWNEFIFDDLKTGGLEDGEYYSGYDLIFAKEPYGGDYIFRGVYVGNQEKSMYKHYVSKRIGTKVRLTGQPSNKFEIIDDFRLL